MGGYGTSAKKQLKGISWLLFSLANCTDHLSLICNHSHCNNGLIALMEPSDFSIKRIRPRMSNRIIIPWRSTSYHHLVVLILSIYVAVCIPGGVLAQEVEFECIYSNSTSYSCSSLCLQGCFYSLLPKPCSPEGQVS